MAPPSSANRRRVQVSAAVLLVVVAGAFIWGLAMFALGRGNPDPTPVVVRDAAQTALNDIDQALARRDWAGADNRIAAARLPAGEAWEAALAARRQQLAIARAAPLVRDFVQLSPHATRPEDWLAVAKDADGYALMHTSDAGARWQEIRRLPGAATILRALGAVDRVLVLRKDAEQVGWMSADGKGAWKDLAWPAGTDAHHAQARFCLTGDGRVLVALGRELHLADLDGAWSRVGSELDIVALAPLEREALVLAQAGAATWRVSVDSGRTFADAPPAVQTYAGQTIRSWSLGSELRLTCADGRVLRFARADGAFIAGGAETTSP